MQTTLADFARQSAHHEEMDSILRACVHCGFCNATCPTYQLTGDELDSPRGRIYLLKKMLEGQTVSALSQHHLDRCLSCRACETTCPSGVRYTRLLDLARPMIESKVPRPASEKLKRKLIGEIFPDRQRFTLLLKTANLLRPLLPQVFRKKISPPSTSTATMPDAPHTRKMLLLTGCVQDSLAPEIDIAAAKVLDRLGISLVTLENSGCCGALNYHLSEHQKALLLARKNIDACMEHLENGAEAIVSTASGCGVMLKDYALLLKDDAEYAEKAARFCAKVKDIGEIIAEENLNIFPKTDGKKLAFHAPCTLQHGQKLNGVVESILQTLGYRLVPVADNHLCCGSAGIYSLMQPELADSLRDNKLEALNACEPELIVSANIGCQKHLQTASEKRLRHWIELLAQGD